MTSRPLPFFADGLRLDADLHLPAGAAAQVPPPVLVAASGYQGLKVLHPERFARALTPRGYAVLTFDYRGFGASEGERGRLTPQDWAEDVRAAVDRLGGCELVDADRIGLLGWALGGGVVIAEASDDPRVRAVAAINAIGDGARATRSMHDEESWNQLLERIEADRTRRATIGRSEITSPWDIVRLDLDGRTSPYVLDELYKAPGYGSGVTLQSAELLLRFSPERAVSRLAGRPLLIVHGDGNELHRPQEAQSLFDRAGEPKRLVYLEGAGHTEWMFDDHPTFHRLIDLIDEFFADALRVTPGATATKG
ncbi:MAG TPA: alpha/beta hydrolase [Solirubrobacteraceae bacterium]|nr:alpha/beta hydrolase [Solirubrobacteraceae bacterium]